MTMLTDGVRVSYDVVSGTCYSLQSDVRLSWSASAEHCRLLGGRLADVDTADQLAAAGHMTAAARHPAAWIGGHRQQTPWTWSDGTLLGSVASRTTSSSSLRVPTAG